MTVAVVAAAAAAEQVAVAAGRGDDWFRRSKYR
jgi:hypothetical protein